MEGLAALSPSQLGPWLQHARAQAYQGQVVTRIALLAKAEPHWFAVAIHSITGQNHSQGETGCRFPLMSVVKPFLLLYLLEQLGRDRVFQWVGMQPSDAPFNSLDQLAADGGRPRNPMINSGAIVLADKLSGRDGSNRCHQFCQWLNQRAGCRFTLDEAMLASVRSVGRERNQTLVHHLAKAKQLEAPDMALDTYEQICCLSGTVMDLAQLGGLLADRQRGIAAQHRQIVNALMLTCGLYEASGEFAVRIGLPMKSGISGALLAVVPNQGAIACYSPALDGVGNPVAGLVFVETLAQALQLNVFR